MIWDVSSFGLAFRWQEPLLPIVIGAGIAPLVAQADDLILHVVLCDTLPLSQGGQTGDRGGEFVEIAARSYVVRGKGNSESFCSCSHGAGRVYSRTEAKRCNRLSGGTHNPLAPTADFLQRAYLPLLQRMGIDIEMSLTRYGFYPAGGGELALRLEVGSQLQPMHL